MSKDEYLITDAPLKALTVFAMPMILGSFFQQVYNMACLLYTSCRAARGRRSAAPSAWTGRCAARIPSSCDEIDRSRRPADA